MTMASVAITPAHSAMENLPIDSMRRSRSSVVRTQITAAAMPS